MASKVTVLGGLVALQCAVLTAIVFFALEMAIHGYSFAGLVSVTVSTGLVGMSLGLIAGLVAIGVLVWSLGEYLLHRFLFVEYESPAGESL